MSSNLHYRTYGNASEPGALLIHGWMVSGQVWHALAPRLAGFRLVVPDLRGTGGSPAFSAPVSLDTYLEDLIAFCEQLDLADCHLVGHSMGGQLAMLLAAACPERFRSLTVLNPVPVDGLSIPGELQPLFRGCGGSREGTGRILDMSCLNLAGPDRAALLEDALRIPADVIGGSFDAWMRGKPGADLGAIRVPATVIATDDPFLPPAFLETAVVPRLPSAVLKRLPGPGHYPQLEAAAATAALLRTLWR